MGLPLRDLGTVPLLSAVLLPLALALGRTARKAAPNVAFSLQKLVYRVAGLVFVGAAVYHAVGAASVPVPPPDLLLYNESSAAVPAPGESRPAGTTPTGVRSPSLCCCPPWP